MTKCRIFYLLVFIICIFIVCPVIKAKDFATQGTIGKVIEDDFIEFLKLRANQIDMKELVIKWKEKAIYNIDNPKAVKGLRYIDKTRIRYYEPIYTLKEDIFNHDKSKVLYHKNYSYNILSKIDNTIKMNAGPYVFIDFLRQKEIDFLESILSKSPSLPNLKIIFVSGQISKIQKRFPKIKVYFDQEGIMVKNFTIKTTPSIVSIEKDRLKIEAIGL